MGLVATFILFICGTISLVVFACSQKQDLVSSDYYEQEIRFQGHLEKLERAHRSARPASIVYDSVAGCIRISVTREAGIPVNGDIQLYRPSAAGMDQHFKLSLDSQGMQSLDASALRSGLWKVRVSWMVDNQEYFLEKSIVVGVNPHPQVLGERAGKDHSNA